MKPSPLSAPIKIRYRSLANSRILWPILDIELTHKENYMPGSVHALVDSGANVSVLHPQIANHLGFNLGKLGSSKPGGFSVSGHYKLPRAKSPRYCI